MANYEQLINELRNQMVLDIECILHEPCFDLSEPHDLRNPLNGFRNGCSGIRIIEAITLEDGDAVVTQSCRNPNRFEDALECKVEDLTTETLVKLLEQVKEDCRSLKLKELRDLISKAGGYIVFDDNDENLDLLFCDNPHIHDDMDVTYHHLDCIKIVGDYLEFRTSSIEQDSNYVDYSENQIPDETLDQIIAYAKEQDVINIELTNEQLKVMDEFYNAIKKMEEVGIAVIRDAAVDGGFYFINGNGLEFVGGQDCCDLDKYVCIQNQISAMEIFAYNDLSDWLFCSDYEDLYAKRI